MRDYSATVAVVAAALLATAVRASSTRYTLYGGNAVTVTQTRKTCLNGQSTAVTTGVVGDLRARVPPGSRTNFNGDRWGRRMTALDRLARDQRGHVVASMFGGPAEEWNLVPQHESINQRKLANNSLLNRWYEWEVWAKERLERGASVRFEMAIRYLAGNGCRPIGFDVRATSPNDPGFSASFDNDPGGSFAASSRPRSKKPKN